MESWLDVSECMAVIESLNAAHPEQQLYAVPGDGGAMLIRAALRDDPLWLDWHDVFAAATETSAQPVPSNPPPF